MFKYCFNLKRKYIFDNVFFLLQIETTKAEDIFRTRKASSHYQPLFFIGIFHYIKKTVRLAKDHLLKGYSETAVLIGWPRGGPWERRCLWPRWPRSGARLTSSSRRLGLDIAPIDSQQMSSLLIVFCCGVEGWVRI